MKGLRNTKWLPVLMTITIIAITGFQVYWIRKSYEREQRTLEMRTNMLFRETVFSLQASKLKVEGLGNDSVRPTKIFLSTSDHPRINVNARSDKKVAGLINAVKKNIKDSFKEKTIIIEATDNKEQKQSRTFSRRQNRLMQFLFEADSLQDSIRVEELTAIYAQRLEQQNIDIPFKINKLVKESEDERAFNQVTLGFSNPITYVLQLEDTFPFILKRISSAILFSVFLIGFTILSFTLLYRNLLKQRRLADIKNEFISNITHELKTPIATVSVAIEALRSFNATMDPQKTKEYLDISANELQRLSLLTDKVLKLSLFEKKEVDLKYEYLDMKELVEEVTNSMRLQFEKNNAEVSVTTEGDTRLEGDRLHLVSVIFNLVDNALKYSKEAPEINIHIEGDDRNLLLSIADKGIGIPSEYKDKVFEKFFRVPTGNLHNAKGYGLGLSYVSHVIKKHKGSIKVDSIEGEGSKFIVNLPKKMA